LQYLIVKVSFQKAASRRVMAAANGSNRIDPDDPSTHCFARLSSQDDPH
jgi:hypothetical protein